jgi:hypothetical protein
MEDEEVIKEWTSKDWDAIIASQHRLFFVKNGALNKKFIEVSYNHISSLEFSKIRPRERLIASIVCLSFSVIINYLTRPRYYFGFMSDFFYASVFLFIIALGLFIWFIIGVDKFLLHINGRKPIAVSRELSELFKFVREIVEEPIYKDD